MKLTAARPSPNNITGLRPSLSESQAKNMWRTALTGVAVMMSALT
ncbi:MAG TPA: hypothetical protein VHX61_00125 [Rhizomicrobium sp.]|nr:hypothetical protein [Rhizomicrobium sp.]